MQGRKERGGCEGREGREGEGSVGEEGEEGRIHRWRGEKEMRKCKIVSVMLVSELVRVCRVSVRGVVLVFILCTQRVHIIA